MKKLTKESNWYKGISMSECIFCNSKLINVFLENNLAWVKWDEFPVSKGHALIISKRHVQDFFGTNLEERIAMAKLIDEVKIIIDKEYKPDGYNIGINCGAAAGQSVMHLHIHVIPRYKGDVINPRGGVRGVIPQKQNY